MLGNNSCRTGSYKDPSSPFREAGYYANIELETSRYGNLCLGFSCQINLTGDGSPLGWVAIPHRLRDPAHMGNNLQVSCCISLSNDTLTHIQGKIRATGT